jgi:HtrA serine peptidase 2
MIGRTLKSSFTLKSHARNIVSRSSSCASLPAVSGTKQRNNNRRDSSNLLYMLSSGLCAAAWIADRNKASCSISQNDKFLTANFVADAIEKVAPAVVNLKTTGGILTSVGSGFIINDEGYIVTNAHVVGSVGRVITVTFIDGTEHTGVVHSMDQQADIAIVKLNRDISFSSRNQLPIARIGSSSALRAGEIVISIGSPKTLQNSCSMGIVSATVRYGTEFGMRNSHSSYIQTDAAVNVGNSGGPLINLAGEVIGICTLSIKNTQGISFAIPMDTASLIIDQLIANKTSVRPYVGLRVVNIMRADGMRAKQIRVLVQSIVPGSPAATAGLQP